MAVVPDQTIALAALNAGFSRDAAVTAVAVALAESGGDATATNHNSDGSTDYGLWQMNSSHSALLASGNWRVPNDNARMAYSLYHGRGNVWSDWVTYNHGKHTAFMGRAAKAVNAVADNGSSLAAGIAALAGGGSNIGDTSADAVNVTPAGLLIPDNVSHGVDVLTSANLWKRVGMVVGGLALIAAGVVLMFETFVGKSGMVGQAVKSLVPESTAAGAAMEES